MCYQQVYQGTPNNKEGKKKKKIRHREMVSCATHIGRNRTWINCEIIPFSPFLTISLAKANLKDLSVHLSLFRQFGLMFIRIWEERLPFVFTAHLLFIQYDRQDSFVLRAKKKKNFSFRLTHTCVYNCTWVQCTT